MTAIDKAVLAIEERLITDLSYEFRIELQRGLIHSALVEAYKKGATPPAGTSVSNLQPGELALLISEADYGRLRANSEALAAISAQEALTEGDLNAPISNEELERAMQGIVLLWRLEDQHRTANAGLHGDAAGQRARLRRWWRDLPLGLRELATKEAHKLLASGNSA